jgi:hypothetical protein
MDDTCNLTGRPCHLTRLGQGRCAPEPSIEQAASCIATLDERTIELAREVEAQDRWIERLRRERTKPKDQGH